MKKNEDGDIKEGRATGSMLCAGFRTVGPCAESFTVPKQAGDRVSEETKPSVNQITTHKGLNMNDYRLDKQRAIFLHTWSSTERQTDISWKYTCAHPNKTVAKRKAGEGGGEGLGTVRPLSPHLTYFILFIHLFVFFFFFPLYSKQHVFLQPESK